MSPALEVVFIKPNETYLKDPSSINPLFDLVASSKGCLGAYHGLKVEQPDVLAVLIVWETLEDHKALIDDKEKYPKVGAAFAQVADMSTIHMFHIYFDFDLADVLNTNAVSYGNIRKLKPGVGADQFLALFKTLTGVPLPEGCHTGGYAKAVEGEEFLLLYGWDDIKFSYPMGENEAVKATMKTMHEGVEEADWGHVKLITYKKYQS